MYSRLLLLLLLLLTGLLLAAQPMFGYVESWATPAYACAQADCERLAWLPAGAGVRVIGPVVGGELNSSARWYEVLLECPCFDHERRELKDAPDTKEPEQSGWTVWHDWYPYWSPDSKRIAAVYANELYIWNPFSGERLIQKKLAPHDLNNMAWSPDGTQLVVAGHNPKAPERNLLLMDAGGQLRTPLRGPVTIVWGVAWSPDGTRIASVGDALHIWDVKRGSVLLTIDIFSLVVAWSPDDRRLALIEYDLDDDTDSLHLRDALNGALLASLDGNANRQFGDVAWASDGAHIAYTTFNVVERENDGVLITDSALNIWDGDNRHPPVSLFETAGRISDIDWSPDGRFLVAAVRNGLLVLDASNGRTVASLIPTWEDNMFSAHDWEGDTFNVHNVDWSPNGIRIAASGIAFDDDSIETRSVTLVWDLTLIPEGPTRAFIHSSLL